MKLKALSPQWTRLLLILVFIAGNFYILSDKPFIKWVSLAILILAIGFILIRLIIVVPSFCSDLYKRSKVQWNGILPEAAKLAKRMGVKLDENHPIGVVPSWAGATVDKGNRRRGDRIKIGSPLIDKLDRFALKGVLAHELAHLKHHNKEYVVRMVILLFAFSGFLTYISFLPSISYIMAGVLPTSIAALVISLISWHDEYKADLVASKYVGLEIMILTLQKVQQVINRPSDTFIHPSFSKRIARLQRKL